MLFKRYETILYEELGFKVIFTFLAFTCNNFRISPFANAVIPFVCV